MLLPVYFVGGGQAQYSKPRNANENTATKSNGNKLVPTTLLPRDILAGREFQQGDEVQLQIVNIYEDEIEASVEGVQAGRNPATRPVKTRHNGEPPIGLNFMKKAGQLIMEAAEELEKYAKELYAD